MALEVRFKVENLGVAVEEAGYTVIDSSRIVIEEGFTSIDENGECVMPITSNYIESGEWVRPTIDNFNGNNFDETGSATDWVLVTPVYVDYGVIQSGFTVTCANETGTNTVWDMGDGTILEELNPTYSYTKNGTYIITSGDFSTTVTMSDIVYFNVELINNKVVCTPQSGVVGVWSFGNGDSSSDKNPEYEYYKNGTYTISHGSYSIEIVLDYYSEGLISSIADNKVILARPIDENGAWNMGDGSTAQEDEHEYAQYGRYLVSIGALVAVANLIPIGFPVCTFESSVDEIEENKVTFIASGGSRYKWIIDGIEYTGSLVTHVFEITGNYTIYCTAYNDNGNADTTSRSIYVYTSNAKPTGRISMIRDELKVTFSANASDIDNDTLSYLWDFGDGTTSKIASPTKTYNNPETPKDPEGQLFNITCVVTDARGLSITLTDSVRVYDGIFYGDNLIISNNFDDGSLEGWESFKVSAEIVVDEGRNVVHVIPNSVGDTNSQGRFMYPVTLVIGQTYELTCTMKVIYHQGSSGAISVRSNNTYEGQKFPEEFGVYENLSNTFVAKSTIGTLWVQARTYGDSEIYLDEVSLREQL